MPTTATVMCTIPRFSTIPTSATTRTGLQLPFEDQVADLTCRFSLLESITLGRIVLPTAAEINRYGLKYAGTSRLSLKGNP